MHADDDSPHEESPRAHRPHRRGRYRIHPDPADAAVSYGYLPTERQRYRVQRHRGRFALASGLSEPGAIAVDAAAERIVDELQRQHALGGISTEAIQWYCTSARSFARYVMSAHGVSELREVDAEMVLSWMHAPTVNGQVPALSTRLDRRTAMRAFFTTARVLGLHDQNPAAVIEEQARPQRHVAPLSDDQINQLKTVARFRIGELRTPTLLALVLSGATVREASFARAGDVDLDNRLLWLHDGGQRTADRWVPIDDEWAFEALQTHVNSIREHATDWQRVLLTYKPRGEAADLRRQSSASNGLTSLMRKARVYQPGNFRVESIREYVAVRVYRETGSLGAVAHRLGMSSLDGVAFVLGLDWRAPFVVDAPPPAIEGETW